MGNSNASRIKCIQLNFYSAIENPLEFYNEHNREQLEKLSDCFKQVLKKEICLSEEELKTYHWDIGGIDKIFHKDRYSLLYNPSVCYVEENNQPVRLVTRKEFQARWSEAFDKAKQQSGMGQQSQQKQKNVVKNSGVVNGPKNSPNKPSPQKGDSTQQDPPDQQSQKKSPTKNKKIITRQHRLNCMVFDCICYLAWLKYLFNTTEVENLEPEQSKSRAKQFVSSLQKFHQNRVDVQMKVSKVVAFIKESNIDVVFMQQITKQHIQLLRTSVQEDIEVRQSYTIVEKDSDSVIIYNNKKLQAPRDSDFQQENSTSFGKDTVLCKVGRYILISSHLSSRPEVNKKQARELLSKIQMLIEPNRREPNKVFILGINSNYFIEEEVFSIYPDEPTVFTSKKCRSFFQPQSSKSNARVQQTKDHLISNCKLLEPRVLKIDGKCVMEETFLPSTDHPYPNFIVYAQIDQ